MVSTVAANLAVPASALVTGPILARALEPKGRGDVAAVIAPISLAGYLFTLGLPQAFTYFVASGRYSTRDLTRLALLLGLLSGVLAVVALELATPYLLASKPHLIPLAQGINLLLVLVLIFSAVRGIIQGTGDFRPVNQERWVSVASRFVVVVVLALLGLLTVSNVAWISQLVLVAGGLMLFVGLRSLNRRSSLEVTEPEVRPILTYGGRVWIGSLSALLIVRLDQVLMIPLTDARQLGLYAVAIGTAEVPTAAFAAVRDVMFSRSAKTDGAERLAQSARSVVVLFIPVAVVFLPVAPVLVTLLFGRDFSDAALMTQILWVASLPVGLAGLYGAGILAGGRPGFFSGVQVAIAALNIVLILLFVPVLGGVGASLVSLLSYIVFAVVAAAVFSRLSGIRIRSLVVPDRADVRNLLALTRVRR